MSKIKKIKTRDKYFAKTLPNKKRNRELKKYVRNIRVIVY